MISFKIHSKTRKSRLCTYWISEWISQRYGESWCEDKQLKLLHKTHISQIRDQEIQDRHTHTNLRYHNNQQGSLIESVETVIKEIYHNQSHAFKINLSFFFPSSYNTVKLWNIVISMPVIMSNYLNLHDWSETNKTYKTSRIL